MDARMPHPLEMRLLSPLAAVMSLMPPWMQRSTLLSGRCVSGLAGAAAVTSVTGQFGIGATVLALGPIALGPIGPVAVGTLAVGFAGATAGAYVYDKGFLAPLCRVGWIRWRRRQYGRR